MENETLDGIARAGRMVLRMKAFEEQITMAKYRAQRSVGDPLVNEVLDAYTRRGSAGIVRPHSTFSGVSLASLEDGFPASDIAGAPHIEPRFEAATRRRLEAMRSEPSQRERKSYLTVTRRRATCKTAAEPMRITDQFSIAWATPGEGSSIAGVPKCVLQPIKTANTKVCDGAAATLQAKEQLVKLSCPPTRSGIRVAVGVHIFGERLRKRAAKRVARTRALVGAHTMQGNIGFATRHLRQAHASGSGCIPMPV